MKSTAKMDKTGETARAAFSKIQSALKIEREECRQDRRFCSIPGAQWEGDFGRYFENKPKFEINKVQLSVIRIFNEYRNNRLTVDFVSKDGSGDDDLADLCDDLFRADVEDSGGQEAFDNAFDEGVMGGIGAWRLLAEYEDDYDDENERQKICLEPIYDADTSVYWDLGAKRQDKADAKFAYIVSSMTPEEFEEEYPDQDLSTWPTSLEGGAEFDWYRPDIVYVCEYYQVEDESYTVHVYLNVAGEEERFTDEDLEEPGKLDMLDAVGTTKIREKRVKRQRVHKYILSGSGIIEDCGLIAGKCIPIVPFYGKRWFVDNIERCMGHVRLSKDAQRIKNVQTSRLGEIAAISPVELPIVTPEQIAGHELQWAEGNQRNEPFRLINPVMNDQGMEVATPPVGYTKSPAIPPALAGLLQVAEQDMQDLLGNQQAGEELQPNMSGKAVELVQNRLDMQTFIYMDNMRKSMQRCGEIWLSMAKDVYVEDGRKLKAMGKDGSVASRVIGGKTLNDAGEIVAENDLSRANFGVSVDVGPATDSRRAATVRALTGLLQMTSDPQDQKILSSMALMNMEGEGLSDLREYKRKELVGMGVLEPSEEERDEMEAAQQNQPPDAQQAFLMAEAEKAKAQATKAEADTGKAVAETEKIKAQTAETLAGIPRDARNSAVDNATKIASTIQNGRPTPPRPV